MSRLCLSLKTSLLILGMAAWLWAAGPAFVPVCAAKTSLMFFHVRQEIFRGDGVLVSQPNRLDATIVRLIHTNDLWTLKDYARWLKREMTYHRDASATAWRNPRRFLARRRGDCKDFTMLNIAVTRVLGYRPHFIALVGPDSSHAVCAFRKGPYFFWFDNARLIKTSAASLRAFAKHIVRHYDYNRVFELNTTAQKWRLLYGMS